jgi:hypothetical protein
MAVTVWGVDPSITEMEWSVLHRIADRGNWDEIVSDDAGHLAPTAGGGTRQVSIAAGDAVAAGVLARSTSAVTTTHDANATGISRIDYVVLNISWAGTNTTGGTIVVVKGSTTSGLPPTLTKTAGLTWQIPLARVTIASGAAVLSAGAVVDVRPLRRRVLRYRSPPAGGQGILQGNTTPKNIATLDIPDPGWPYRLRVFAQVKFDDLVGNGFGVLDISLDGTSSVQDSRPPDKNHGLVQLHWSSGVLSGEQLVRLRMVANATMTETLNTLSAYADFVVEVIPS